MFYATKEPLALICLTFTISGRLVQMRYLVKGDLSTQPELILVSIIRPKTNLEPELQKIGGKEASGVEWE